MLSKKMIKLYMCIIIFALLLSVFAITLSYFSSQATGTNNGVNTKTAKLGLALDVRRVTSEKTIKLAPLSDNELKSAVTGTANGSCIDSLNKGRCQVYEIKLKNTGNVTASLNGTLELTSATSDSAFTNLKWQEIRSATDATAFGTVHTMSDTTWKTNYIMGTQAATTFYIVIWISETGEKQNNVDKGSFNGTITFNSAAGASVSSSFSG